MKPCCTNNQGKTSLCEHWKDNRFCSDYVKTIGVDLITKRIKQQGNELYIKMWDASGQDRFRTLTDYYLRTCDSVIIVYDVTDRKSFEGVVNWAQIVMDVNGRDIPIAVVANKTDAVGRCVSAEEGDALALEIGANYFETSCKEGTNVDEVFAFALMGNRPPTPFVLLPVEEKARSPTRSPKSSPGSLPLLQFEKTNSVMKESLNIWTQMFLFLTCKHWQEEIVPISSQVLENNQRMA